jgi:hypothetical protein
MDVEKWYDEAVSFRPDLYDNSYKNDQPGYQARFLPIVDQQIFYAGVRLAALLNDIFDNRPIPTQEVVFRQSLEAIVGDLNSFVYFRP